MFTPTSEQQDIINHFNGHAMVVAGPGSGKTTTLIAHVLKLILERNISKNDIWIMAFNRDISLTLKEKLQKELGEKSPQVTTIHTFILSQTLKHGTQLLDGFEIADNLGEFGMENLLWKQIVKRLKEKHGINQISQGKRLDIRHIKGQLWDKLRDYWLTSQKPDDALFDKFNFEVERLKKIYKIIFLDELAIKFLDALKANPSFRQDVAKPRIVIDEFQDLNPTEHGILQQFHNEGTTFIVVGDDDQAVNDFRRAHADYIRDFADIYKPVQYPLARDRRCPKEILELADEFVKGLPRLDKSPGHALHKGKVDIVNFNTDEDELLGIPNIVKKYLSLFPQYKNDPQILILSGATGKVKGQSRISEIIKVLKDAGIDSVTGKKKDDPLDNEWGLAFKSLITMLIKGYSPMNLAAWLSVADMKIMEIVNKYIENEEQKGSGEDFLKAVYDMIQQNKNLEKMLFDINGLKETIKDDNFTPEIVTDFIPDNLTGEDVAKSFIQKVWEELQRGNAIKKIDEPSNEESTKGHQFLQLLFKKISEDVRKPEIGRIHVTTYRKAKGLEADLVIVASVDSNDFFNNPQKRRLLYVATTRSKKNLILTFADKRSGARRFTRGRSEKFKGVPKVYRSPLIPSSYNTQVYSETWLENWEPI